MIPPLLTFIDYNVVGTLTIVRDGEYHPSTNTGRLSSVKIGISKSARPRNLYLVVYFKRRQEKKQIIRGNFV